MINKDNFKQELFEFAKERYRTKFKVFYKQFWDEFPYKYKKLGDELHFKNWLDWLMIEKVLPETGKTIVEEYVTAHPELSEDFRQCLMRMRKVVRGKFLILSVDGFNIRIKNKKTGEEYSVKVYNNPKLKSGYVLEGRIHAFDNYYRTCGAFLTYQLQPSFIDPALIIDYFEQDSIEKIEEKVINNDSSIISLLKNYPFQWIDGICKTLNLQEKLKKEKIKAIAFSIQERLLPIINELNNSSKHALWLVLQEGGIVKYHKLRNFSDEISFWWNEKNVPTSAIGALRVRALLFVGHSYFGNKKYKTALIPEEIRAALFEILSQEFKKDKEVQQKLN